MLTPTNHTRRSVIGVFVFASLIAALTASAQDNDDRTLSPYFFVVTDDDGVIDNFPLMGTTVDVNIAGVIADVRVRQVYANRGLVPIEAIYAFPGSTRAAVYGMTMTVGDRIVEAKIREREQAKKEFNEAKREGKSASLLQQNRPNVFQMNVANIMPGDEIVVELAYTELLVPEDRVYEFAYPTVIGPRYSEIPADGAAPTDKWIANPYLAEGESAGNTFELNVALQASMPIQEVMSHTHNVHIDYVDEAHATIRLNENEIDAGNRDYILRYRLAGGRIDTGLLLHEGADENVFLLMLQPPKRVRPAEIPPREYIFVLDISGSMHGFPLNTAKTLLRNLISGLRPVDTFNVLFFSGGSHVMSSKSLPASNQNINRAVKMIESRRSSGSTQLLPAMKHAFNLPAEEHGSRSIVIVTDGFVAVETQAFDYVRDNIDKANVFAFGIGSSVNRFIIEGLARVGYGEPFIVTDPGEAPAAAERFRTYIETPVLTDVTIDFDGFDVYDLEPEVMPDVLAERPLVVCGKWRGRAHGTIDVAGMQGDGEYHETIALEPKSVNDANSALKYLWARRRITELADYQNIRHDDDRVAEITNLGLSYNLLTAYTSFIAIDHVVRNTGTLATPVKQPLPLPKGVTNHAVGKVPTVPEPDMIALLAIVTLYLLWRLMRQRRQTAPIQDGSSDITAITSR